MFVGRRQRLHAAGWGVAMGISLTLAVFALRLAVAAPEPAPGGGIQLLPVGFRDAYVVLVGLLLTVSLWFTGRRGLPPVAGGVAGASVTLYLLSSGIFTYEVPADPGRAVPGAWTWLLVAVLLNGIILWGAKRGVRVGTFGPE